tara:strand:+ start:7364 stop:7816 length:453 start_codon:yes stop_codon:yes gene_type:complete
MQKILIILLIFFYSHTSSISSENDYFLSLKNSKVNVRYGPGFDYPIKYVYKKRFLPVKIIDSKENFRRIIDHKKNSGWIHISQLKKSNSLIVLEDKIIFSKNSKFSKPLLRLEKGRLVILKKCISNWCKIKSGNFTGWLQTQNSWGKNLK